MKRDVYHSWQSVVSGNDVCLFLLIFGLPAQRLNSDNKWVTSPRFG